jgi:hypothetical protein
MPLVKVWLAVAESNILHCRINRYVVHPDTKLFLLLRIRFYFYLGQRLQNCPGRFYWFMVVLMTDRGGGHEPGLMLSCLKIGSLSLIINDAADMWWYITGARFISSDYPSCVCNSDLRE